MTALPVMDPTRTVAALVDSPIGPLVVYGTVLPWHCDRGDAPGDPSPRNWEEHHRVIPLQAAEWKRLAEENPGLIAVGAARAAAYRRSRGQHHD